ncbi:glycoside hydrolase family 104 protein [Pseudomonas sp. G34]|uniref:glycoside hydrolase family 24 protein n=1 Tax=Pseudomonas sp. G34 TaxID=3059083 RepID=UPI002809FA91|nr:glycoside hydrolase family 104 protein [Pseudomonas sp. G34]MDQ7987087.1 glycoside hydrolase family 104 protein [Pseudomonas sp. G34]
MARLTAHEAGGANVLAFLDMLAWSEGTDHPNQRSIDDGYDVLVGGQLFTDYSKHPRVLVPLPRYGIKSTAAGRYQFLARTWDAIVENYGFIGRFIPRAQDLAAVKLLTECGALPHIQAGRISEAIAAAAPIWASLPGAGYGQHEHKLTSLLKIYADERAAEQCDQGDLLAMFTACGGELAA